MMTNRLGRTLFAIALCAAVTTAGGCASFEAGYHDTLENKPSTTYNWGQEAYEVPMGLIVTPFALVLTPFIALIPAEEHGMGYFAGDTWASIRLLLDPNVNYGG